MWPDKRVCSTTVNKSHHKVSESLPVSLSYLFTIFTCLSILNWSTNTVMSFLVLITVYGPPLCQTLSPCLQHRRPPSVQIVLLICSALCGGVYCSSVCLLCLFFRRDTRKIMSLWSQGAVTRQTGRMVFQSNHRNNTSQTQRVWLLIVAF